MCEWMGVSTSGFYQWRDRPATATARRREDLKTLITTIFDDSDRTYGHRRIHAELVRCGVAAGPELVRQLMRQLGLQPCQPRPWRPTTTVAGAAPPPAPDPIRRDFTADAPGSSWSATSPTSGPGPDRKSTRLNSSHPSISYAV